MPGLRRRPRRHAGDIGRWCARLRSSFTRVGLHVWWHGHRLTSQHLTRLSGRRACFGLGGRGARRPWWLSRWSRRQAAVLAGCRRLSCFGSGRTGTGLVGSPAVGAAPSRSGRWNSRYWSRRLQPFPYIQQARKQPTHFDQRPVGGTSRSRWLRGACVPRRLRECLTFSHAIRKRRWAVLHAPRSATVSSPPTITTGMSGPGHVAGRKAKAACGQTNNARTKPRAQLNLHNSSSTICSLSLQQQAWRANPDCEPQLRTPCGAR
jgi:hypothetical protein